MAQPELDSALLILENPVRRQIIERLSREPAYALQLSKELGIGQQLIAKHLETMEQAGIVASKLRESPNGPKRRQYSLSRTISVTVDVAPNLFNTHVFSFDKFPEDDRLAQSLVGRVEKILEGKDEKEKIQRFTKFLEDVDARIGELENQRAVLLYARDLAMREAALAVSRVEEQMDNRRVLYHVLAEHSRNVAEISRRLNLREANVREILSSLQELLG